MVGRDQCAAQFAEGGSGGQYLIRMRSIPAAAGFALNGFALKVIDAADRGWPHESPGVRGLMPSYHLALDPDLTEIPRLLDWVETCCGAAGVKGDIASKLALALDEAVANVINHAFADSPPPHHLAMTLTIDADRVAAEIVDNGGAFDPTGISEPDCTLPLASRDAGGLGIHLIRKMMDRVDYRRAAGENRLRLEKAR
jgi:serine/threonine-protein kinase RsbW